MPQSQTIAEPISTLEAAARYHVTPNYITMLARKGAITARKLGRDWMIDESSLKSYLMTPHKRGPKPKLSNPRRAKSSDQNMSG
jgi:excisionase family DNA binding protein